MITNFEICLLSEGQNDQSIITDKLGDKIYMYTKEHNVSDEVRPTTCINYFLL